jgi:hypothetical protein
MHNQLRKSTNFNIGAQKILTLVYLYLIPMLRQFRIIRCNRQAALQSAMFNYTPLVTSGDKKYAANIIANANWH